MENKTILGSWCSEPNCKFIDDKHIQIELLAHIWYSYDNDSKTNLIKRKFCFVKEIDFNELIDEVEIIEENKRIEKIPAFVTKVGAVDGGNIEKYTHMLFEQQEELYLKLNELIDKVNSLENK